MPRAADLRAPVLTASLVLAAAVLAGCGDDPSASGDSPPTSTSTSTAGSSSTSTAATTATLTSTTPSPSTATGAAPPAVATTPPPPRSWTATCPTATTSALGCRGVRGRVLAIQSLDPDGDGDLHVVAVGGDVTAPGITVFDVRASLRPRRDPVKGEYVTGAGPVFRGSLGQHQIQVDAFRVWRPRG